MATIIITGEVQAKRIAQLTGKSASEIISLLSSYKIAIDNEADDESFQISLTALQDVIGGIFRPAVEPALVGGVLTLNGAGNTQILFEPRKTAGDAVIDVNFTHVFEEVASANLMSEVLKLTGTRIITMPANVEVSNPSTLGVWDDGAKTLTMSAGVADKIEFQYLWYKTDSVWLLKVSEVAL